MNPGRTTLFRVLGGLELREDGHDIRSVLAQPRRVALLAYLSLRGSGGARRDTLLALFWPESDADRARGALRNAVHFLRRSLGAAVVESRPEGILCVNSDHLWCDATEFERYAEAGRHEEALELYRGDLLEGFFISGSGAFERWLEEERGRLRRRAMEMAAALSCRADLEGKISLATHHARRAANIAPDDEPATRRLISLLAAGGDRAGALRIYRDFADRLGAEFHLQPTSRTRALVSELHLRETGAPAPAGVGPAPGDVRPTPASADTAAGVNAGAGGGTGIAAGTGTADRAGSAGSHGSAPAHALRAVWRRTWLLRAAALVTLIGAGTWIRGQLHARGDGEEVAAGRVAILPFSYRGGEEFRFLGDGISNLLGSNLDGAGGLVSVEANDVVGALEALDGADARPVHPEQAREVARRFGAGLFVLGSVVEMNGDLRVSAALYERGRRWRPPVQRAAVQGNVRTLFSLVDELTTKLLVGRNDRGLARSAMRSTRSLGALKAYLEGETALRGGRYSAAVDAFQRAVSEDSAFALAYYGLSDAADWAGRSVLARHSLAVALAHADRLSREDSLLIAGRQQHMKGAASKAMRLYRRAIALQPGHVEANFQLGEVLFHWGPALGRPAAEAHPHFERVLALEPEHVGALIHLTRIAAGAGRAEEVSELVARALRVSPEAPWTLEMKALGAFSARDPAGEDSIIEEVAATDPRTALAVLASVAAWGNHMPAAARLARRLSGPPHPDAVRAEAVLMLAQIEMARGRWRSASWELTAASALPASRALEYRAMLASLPEVTLPRAEIEALRVAVLDSTVGTEPRSRAADPRYLGSGSYPPLLWDGLLPATRDYLYGRLSARLGDMGGALRAVGSLEALAAGGERIAPRLARVVRGAAMLKGGDPRAALGALGEVRLPAAHTFESLTDYPRSYERYLRGELLSRLGRSREAMRWFATFPDPSAHDLCLLAIAHLRRAEIHDTLGEMREAGREYARFIELWKEADPELQPVVTRARRRLAALGQLEPSGG